MGLLDFLKPSSGSSNKCAYCKREDVDLPFSKKLDGVERKFCSKECSRQFRKQRKKDAKRPSDAGGGGLPW